MFLSDFVNLSIVRLPQHLMNKASSFHHLKIWAQCKVVVATQMIKAYSFFVKKFLKVRTLTIWSFDE
jgi:hypothetical protein